MSRRSPLESVSCTCGHGYCVFCIKKYIDTQKVRESLESSEVESLVAAHLELEDVEEAREKLRSSLFEYFSKEVQLSRRVSGQICRNSQPLEEAIIKVLQPDFDTRDEFIQYSHDVTLDPDTAHNYLALSEANNQVTNIGRSQGYLDGPDRFDFFWQILSVDSLAKRSYFELKWNGPWIYVALAYYSLQRHGNTKACGLGGNKESWALFSRQNRYKFWHDEKSTQVTCPVESPRIGVYLDFEAGVLTFYSVQDEEMTAIHRVQTKFTQALRVGLWMAEKGLWKTPAFGEVHLRMVHPTLDWMSEARVRRIPPNKFGVNCNRNPSSSSLRFDHYGSGSVNNAGDNQAVIRCGERDTDERQRAVSKTHSSHYTNISDSVLILRKRLDSQYEASAYLPDLLTIDIQSGRCDL
ncbi:hypothetical protein WMY93_024970 [Mugilogobius chulae]|uniref:B30.2/SPRY domain-containing protein n=1 Tax=Mugilogobius chulae TaxID=88201 RepID=A0AAW0N5Y6_9GOBI